MKQGIGALLLVLGLLCLAGGAYLLPARSWRNICVGLLCIGALLLLLGILLLRKRAK